MSTVIATADGELAVRKREEGVSGLVPHWAGVQWKITARLTEPVWFADHLFLIAE